MEEGLFLYSPAFNKQLSATARKLRSSNYSQNSYFCLNFPAFTLESIFNLYMKIMNVVSCMLVVFLLKII